jgi:Arc/MetJ-type ribon-helix-helix transcriptional regulator
MWMAARPEREKPEPMVPQNYRLPAQQVEFIELLVKKQIFGSNRSAVVRNLLTSAIRELIEQEFVKKSIDTFRLLKDEGDGKQ